MERLVVVNNKDEPIGLEDKIKCHQPSGILHRAFTALVFDEKSRLLLGKRYEEKMLWKNCWDGTFASHPTELESFEQAAKRRMPQEIGISCDMEYVYKFEYHIPYKDIGSENEICGTLIGEINSATKITPVKEEISQIMWISPQQLLKDIIQNPMLYCPWMLIALYLLPKAKTKLNINDWMSKELIDTLQKATRKHIQDNRWRML